MDGNEFDNLVKRLGGMASRRAAVAGMLAGALGATRIGQAAAKRKGRSDVGTAACGDQGCLLGGIQCLAGFGLDAACGNGGNACINCAATPLTPRCSPNTNFSGGSCQAVLPCNTAQCQLEGACVSLTDPRVCGRFANGTCQQGCGASQVCTSPTNQAAPLINRTCAANSCSSTCTDGCCTGLNCNLGNTNTACGTGGVTCSNCTAICGSDENACAVDPADGVRKCECQFEEEPPPVEVCGPSNCPTGCCREVSVGVFTCVSGIDKTACGTGGQTCQACGRKKKCDTVTKVCKRKNKK